jgi:hypothetical protein
MVVELLHIFSASSADRWALVCATWFALSGMTETTHLLLQTEDECRTPEMMMTSACCRRRREEFPSASFWITLILLQLFVLWMKVEEDHGENDETL